MSNASAHTAAIRLSVVVPAFNEELLLESSLRSLRTTLDSINIAAEIILVDDGSKDRTGAIADSLAKELPGLRVLHQPNQGIGGAFLSGVGVAAGEYVMLWPVDMPATPDDFAPYSGEFGRADVIVGFRRRRVGYNPLMLLNAWIYPRLVTLLFGLRIRDVNWIHAYRRASILPIRFSQRGIPMLAEALVRLRDAGATFSEVEVVMKRRLHGRPSASRPIVMWRTLAGLFSFWRTWRKEVHRLP